MIIRPTIYLVFVNKKNIIYNNDNKIKKTRNEWIIVR
jgi:hypothetical protein